jgi:hypothetical protein
MLNHDPIPDHPPMCGRELATHAPCPEHPRLQGHTQCAYGTGYADGQQMLRQAVSSVLPDPSPSLAALKRCQGCTGHLEFGVAVRQTGQDAYGNPLWAHTGCPDAPQQHRPVTAHVVGHSSPDGPALYGRFLAGRYNLKESTE